MTELTIFISTCILVFALGFQSLNVNNGHYLAAFLTSFAIAASNLVLFKTVPQADWLQMLAYMSGGPVGIVASMWAHKRWMPRKTVVELDPLLLRLRQLYIRTQDHDAGTIIAAIEKLQGHGAIDKSAVQRD